MNDEKKTLLDTFDLRDLPPEEQEAALLEVGNLVLQGTVLRLTERMDEPMRAEFDDLLGKDPSDEEVIQFLTSRVPDADRVVEEVLAGIRSDILSGTGT